MSTEFVFALTLSGPCVYTKRKQPIRLVPVRDRISNCTQAGNDRNVSGVFYRCPNVIYVGSQQIDGSRFSCDDATVSYLLSFRRWISRLRRVGPPNDYRLFSTSVWKSPLTKTHFGQSGTAVTICVALDNF